MSLPAPASHRSTCAGWGSRTAVSLIALAAPGATATPAAAATDTTPPAPVAGLVTSADKTRAKLDWTSSSEKDLAGYLVYRASASDGEFAKLTAKPVTSSEYSDYAAPAGLPSYYRIAAVDTSGNESTAVNATVTRKDATAPTAPKALSASRLDGDGGVSLKWTANDETDVAGYVVSRATSSGGTYTKLTTPPTKDSAYVDKTASRSANYYYKVTAVDYSGNTSSAASVSALLPDTTATTYGTGGSQSVLIKGSDVTVRNVTIENSFDEAAFIYANEQAVALKTTGDRLLFDNVRLLGNQDTLLVDSPDSPVIARSYFYNSYIEGDVDFIFGRGTAVFDHSTINALSRGSSSNNGYITAASTSDKNPNGFLIIDSTITSNAPAGTFSLGRPWRGWTDGYTKNGVVYNSRGQVTIRNTALPAAIRTTQPWADMSPKLWTDGRFSEYGNTGAGAGVNANRPQLSDAQAADATPQKYLAGTDAWNPTVR